MSESLLSAQDCITFGRLLRQERKALGLFQSDVAQQIGTRRQTIIDLEAGKNVGLHVAFAALAALGKRVTITDERPDVEGMRKQLGIGDD